MQILSKKKYLAKTFFSSKLPDKKIKNISKYLEYLSKNIERQHFISSSSFILLSMILLIVQTMDVPNNEISKRPHLNLDLIP